MMSAPAVTDTDTDLAADLRLAIGRLARRLRQVQLGGLTSSQMSALSSIENLGSVRLGDLAMAEGVSGPTLTKIVSHLESIGLVARSADATDRRAARVSLTAEGRSRLKRIRSDRDAYLVTRLAGLDADGRAALHAVLPLLRGLSEEGER
jgi:DNA-binding MarR family transcriptional regulator